MVLYLHQTNPDQCGYPSKELMTLAKCPWPDPAGPHATSIRGSAICAFLLDTDRCEVWMALWYMDVYWKNSDAFAYFFLNKKIKKTFVFQKLAFFIHKEGMAYFSVSQLWHLNLHKCLTRVLQHIHYIQKFGGHSDFFLVFGKKNS